jgi:hypothetical protein
VKTIWFKDCINEEDREAVRLSVKNSIALHSLRIILEDELRALEAKEIANDYTSPVWSHQQADRNGDKRRLKSIIELLNFEKE